ncbi:GIY-YIG nuclease family protein [Candidatus Nomurabacteria bacterium]|nr:GIY-YIG nuclease family protein [Candidatus Nomurabacteria bacterium]MCB9820421.1 GIY-YIG nuclease family protein [Candidatus Nomurabacteria bacterium]
MTGVYIIKSVKNSRYYIGSTIDIDRRLKEHNSGKVFSTKGNIPWELKIFLNCDNITDARRYEHRLKKYKRKDVIEKVILDGKFPWDYKS